MLIYITISFGSQTILNTNFKLSLYEIRLKEMEKKSFSKVTVINVEQ